MKAIINGIEVHGTPKEVAKYLEIANDYNLCSELQRFNFTPQSKNKIKLNYPIRSTDENMNTYHANNDNNKRVTKS